MDNDFNNKLSFGSDGGSSSFTVSVTGDCEGDKTITYDTEGNLTDWANITYTNNTFTVACRGKNETTSKYTGALILKIGDDTCTSDKINCEQAALSCTPGPICTCYVVGKATATSIASDATKANVTWPYSAITWSQGEDCRVTSSVTEQNTATGEVTDLTASTCNSVTQSGNLTWANHKACTSNGCSESNSMTVPWTVTKVKPAGCDCGCGDLTVEAPSNIQAEGGSGVSLGRITPSCVENVKITSITYNGSESGWINATNSADSITSAFELTGNVADWSNETGSQPRTATVTVTGKTINNPNCSTSYTITQEAAGCTCQNGFGGATAQTLPTKIVGGDEITVWKVDKTCGQLYAITEGNCIASSGVSENGGYYYITAKTSDVSSSCDFKVGYQLKVNGEICTNASGMSTDITVVPALDCDCYDLIPITSNGDEIEWSNILFLTSETESYRLTYKFKTGKEDCFDGVNISYSWEGDDNVFYITTGTTDGKTYVDVQPKSSAERGQFVTIYFNYVMSDGTTCEEWGYVDVEFNPDCVCNNLLPNDACIQRQVPLSAGTYPLGTFGVVGCGEFSGKSTSSQVEEVIITQGDEKYEVSVKLKRYGDESGNTPPEQPDAPSDIDIYSLASGQALAECHHIYRIWQKKDYVNCDRVNRIIFEDEEPLYAENSTAYLAELSDSQGEIALNSLKENNIITSFTTQYDWIDPSSISIVKMGFFHLQGHIGANESVTPRTNEITINLDKNKLKQIYGICENCLNNPFTVTVTQQGDPSYACTCPDNQEVEIRYFGAEASINCQRVLNSCFASSGLKFIPVGFSDAQAFYNDYVSVNNWLSIKLSVISNDPSAPDKSYLKVAYKALGHTDTTQGRSYTFEVKVNFDTDKQPDECIQEIVFNQEKAINVTCEELLASIGTSTINARATSTSVNVRDDFAWMNTRLMEGVRLSGETVQSQDCGDGSWITMIEPGTGNYTNHLYVNMTQNVSAEHDHSTNERCAKIKIFYIDEQGNRLKIGDSECGSIEAVLTQNGYSGDCMACADATPILPGPDFTPYRDTTYTEGDYTYPAFYEGDGNSERPLFEISIPSSYYYDGTDTTRCFDLIAKTTHTESFAPYSDGEYLHVILDAHNRKWVIYGKIKPTSEPLNAVAVEVYLQRRNLAEGTSTQCEGTAYITDIIILKN